VNNLWHDIAGLNYGAGGEFTSTKAAAGILAESNLVYRTTPRRFHQHYGETNIVRNNILRSAATIRFNAHASSRTSVSASKQYCLL